ncbi:MAG: hypothetical protein RIR96_1271 [Bacteroidota bacterium]
MRKIIILFLGLFLYTAVSAQNDLVRIQGRVTDSFNIPIRNVLIASDRMNAIHETDSNGMYRFVMPNADSTEIRFYLLIPNVSYTWTTNRPFADSLIEINVKLGFEKKYLSNITIYDDREKRETGKISIDPKNALNLPSATGGIEALIKTLVGSSNELSSGYNVRGGNFDENLIYINDFEVFRPYLVSQGQQEGLSLINPELVKNISFFNGGFGAKYGDKMSSILDIQYKKPRSFSGSAYVSLLEQGISLEASSANNKLGLLVAARNRNNQSILSSQATVGSYLPSASDFQGLLQYKINEKNSIEILGIYSKSRFNFFPESVQKTAAVFSPLYASNLGLDIYFEGAEKDRYATSLTGLTWNNKPREKWNIKWMISHFRDREKESLDIASAYLFGERDLNNTSSTFGEIINPLGAGRYQQYARNVLNIDILTAQHRGNIQNGSQQTSWGVQIDKTFITDRVNQFEWQDSAGYTLPYTPGNLTLSKSIISNTSLNILKWSGFVQHQFRWNLAKGYFSLQPGIRFQSNNLNHEWLISPRLLCVYNPEWKKDIIFRSSIGLYQQPPFYREFRKPDGTIQTNIKAQKSAQWIVGMDYLFTGINGRKYRISSEAYYKSMWDVIPYDIDNVRISYLSGNNAKAYSTGLEFRLFSELVKDAESWISLGIMRTREDLKDDHYFEYLNAQGEIIQPGTADQQITDSLKRNIGYLRRPTDRLITAGLFLQDYLATNKNFKMHVNLLYGSNLPYNIPNSTKYRNALVMDPYIRVDLGLSALLLGPKNKRRSHSPFKSIDNIWVSLEVFNVINRSNTISFQLIRDYANATYAIPNKLTPRLLNLKLLARF